MLGLIGSILRSLPGLVLALLVASLPIPALAQSGAEFATRSKSAILMDAETGAVLFQHNADELLPPASMSKLMTIAVVFRALKTGEIKPEDELVMSEHAWRTGGAPSRTSAMFVPIHSKVTVNDLVQGIIVQSGNDACIAIAEGMAGTEQSFALRMTDEARRIGLKKSTFRNSTGLYHPEHLMTARELAMLARHLIKNYPERYKIFAQREFLYRKHRFINRNPLLFLNIGADGLKTGFVSQSGYGLVGSAVQDGKRLIAVLSGLESANQRKEEGRRLLEWGFRSFGEFKLFDAEEVVGSARVWGGEQMYVPLGGQSDLTVILPRYPANQRLRAEIIYQGPLKPPIHKGDVVATLRVTSTSSAVNEMPLHAMEDVEKAGFVRRGLDSLLMMAFSWVPL